MTSMFTQGNNQRLEGPVLYGRFKRQEAGVPDGLGLWGLESLFPPCPARALSPSASSQEALKALLLLSKAEVGSSAFHGFKAHKARQSPSA